MRPIFFKALLLSIALLAPAPVVLAQGDVRTETVHFAAGTSGTTIRGKIAGDEFVVYEIGAEAGQRMEIRLNTDNGANYFNVYEPGRGPGDEALAVAEQVGPMVPDLNVFDGVLPTSGVYRVSVYLYRNAARRGETANYSLDISITGDTGAVVQGDFADGLQGGPDFWEVRLGDPNGILNAHSGPSTDAPTVGRFPNAAILRNLGCRINEGRRWCQVEATAPGGITGWVAGDFLVESAAPRSASASSTGAEPQTYSERVQFPAGQYGAVLSRTLKPGEAINYVLGARNGQFLDVQFLDRAQGTYFNIFVPSGSTLYESQATGNMPYRGQLYQNGDHTITVYNTGSAPVTYNLEVAIE